MLIDFDWRKIDMPSIPGVTIEIRPFSWRAFQEVLALIGPATINQGAGTDTKALFVRFADPIAAEVLTKILPEFCRNLSGVRIRRDNREWDATVGDLLEHAAFLPACWQLLFKLFELSTFRDESGN
jgi:hypothetical protein